MSTPHPNEQAHAEYRTRQRAVWDDSAAGWSKWWSKFEAGANVLSERLVEHARLAPGMLALDVSTGLGEPALRVARKVGPSGTVVAVDLARPMLLFARERAREAALDNLRFVQMEGEHCGLAAQVFEAATFRWGPMLMEDPVASLREVGRLLRPGARLATSVWGTGRQVPFIALPGLVAEEVGGLPRPPPGTPGPLRMGRPGELEEALAAAGFVDVRCEAVTVVMEFASAQEFVTFVGDISSTLRRALDERPAEVRARVWSELANRAQEFARADGSVRFENLTWCASGAVPA